MQTTLRDGRDFVDGIESHFVVLSVYRVKALVGRTTCMVQSAQTRQSMHCVHPEHDTPTRKVCAEQTQQKQGVHLLHRTCVSGQYTPIHHAETRHMARDNRLEIRLNTRARKLSIEEIRGRATSNYTKISENYTIP